MRNHYFYFLEKNSRYFTKNNNILDMINCINFKTERKEILKGSVNQMIFFKQLQRNRIYLLIDELLNRYSLNVK